MSASSLLPVFFVSHGAPTMAIEPSDTTKFLKSLGKSVRSQFAESIRGILVVSAHWETQGFSVKVTSPKQGHLETIHDFFGFPKPLYQVKYPAPSSEAISDLVLDTLKRSGISASPDSKRGLDHGAYIPLLHMFPLGDSSTDLPVVQLSISSTLDYSFHLKLGAALAPLRKEGVLIIGSGGFVHNFAYLATPLSQAPWALEWERDLSTAITKPVSGKDRTNQVESYLKQNEKHFRLAHAREEHFLPLIVALGAGSADLDSPDKWRESSQATKIHERFEIGTLSLAAFQFD